jgi:hypothetical protein
MSKRPSPARAVAWAALLLIGGAVPAALTGCDITPTVDDPVATLSTPSVTGAQHRRALDLLGETPADDAEANKTLERVISNEGYTPAAREKALDLLAQRDLPRAMRALRLTLPNTEAWAWKQRACEIIAERQWTDLTPALVSSWARTVLFVDDVQRPEHLALAKLHGEDRVIDVVFDLFAKSRSVGEQGLRTRCWDLLYRLGQRERLVALLNSADIPEDDLMLRDLQAAARDLGLVPHNREEILWLRKLRQPEHAEFWTRAASVTKSLSADRRAELEIRDLPIIVSASVHDPDVLAQSTDELYRRVEEFVRGQKHHAQESNFEGFGGGRRERLHEYAGQLTWGDLAAMLIAIRAMQVPEVIEHLFDYTARDRADETTEYGGVISLDAKNRFEVLEFPPVIREQDQKFIASQDMLDAAYTGIFHFHLHVQHVRNERFAGPGFGDVNYADNVRANCLVFTSINEDTLNVDYYRYGRVAVDLGEIRRK